MGSKKDSIWSVRGVDEELRQAVRKQSIRSNEPLGTTLNDILQQHFARASQEDIETENTENDAESIPYNAKHEDLPLPDSISSILADSVPAQSAPIEPQAHPHHNFQESEAELTPQPIDETDPLANILFTEEELLEAIGKEETPPKPDRPILSLPDASVSEPAAQETDNALTRPNETLPAADNPRTEFDIGEQNMAVASVKPEVKTTRPAKERKKIARRFKLSRSKIIVVGALLGILSVSAMAFNSDDVVEDKIIVDEALGNTEPDAPLEQVELPAPSETVQAPELTETFVPTTPQEKYEVAMGLLVTNTETFGDPGSLGLFKSSASEGYAPAMFKLALYLLQNETDSEDDKSDGMLLLRGAALKEHAPAQLLLGAHLIAGNLVEKDETEGALWLLRAAENGNIEATHLLGLQLSLGRGVEQNLPLAYKMLSIVSNSKQDAELEKTMDQLYHIIPPNKLGELRNY